MMGDKGKIILAYFGTGKTYMNKNYPNYIDFEEAYFKDINLMVNAAIIASEVYELNVLMPCAPPVIKRLQELGKEFTCYIPDISLEEEYKKRYLNRYDLVSPESYGLAVFFKEEVGKLAKIDCNKVILQSGEYLSDYLERE